MPPLELSSDRFLSEIKTGNIKPVYIFIGEDLYEKEATIKLLKEKLMTIHNERLIFDFVQGSEEDISEIISRLYKSPLFGGCTFLAVRNFDGISKITVKSFVKYLERPNKRNLLVLLSEKKDVKSLREDIISLIRAHGEIVKFPKLAINQLIIWAKAKFKKNGLDITEHVLHKFLEMVGDDRYILEAEILKASLYFQDKNILNEEDLNTYWIYSRNFNIFDLADALLDKDYSKITRLVDKIYESEKDMPVKLLGVLNRQIHLMLTYKDLISKRIPRQKILNLLAQGREFVLKKIEMQSKKWEIEDLKLFLRKLRELDVQIKQGAPANLSLSALIFTFKHDL